MHVIATAGHVDHGKSTLVRALTGTDPDRLAEEKLRGLTIDLGFASTALASGEVVAFVDVPGHIRFLKNMLAGVGSVAACVLVVDPREGWMPQTEEHLRILALLGIGRGVVVLTKADVADDDTVELARQEAVERTAGTFLAGADVVVTDSVSGRGLDVLRAALGDLCRALPPPIDLDRPRLWVDRAFAARGAGTVVTGTLTGGRLTEGDELVAVLGAAGGPARAGPAPVRVRGLQALHRHVEEAHPGWRVAVNLSGVRHHQLARGDALVRAGQWHLSTTADVELAVLGSIDHPVTHRGAYLAHIGSGEHPVALRVIGGGAIRPGDRRPVRLRWRLPLPLVPGDRVVVRESGRGETVGGGEVLEVDPLLPASRARPDRSTDRVVAERGWIDAEELRRRTGTATAATAGRWVVAPDALDGATRALTDRIAAAGDLGLDVASLDERERCLLPLLGDVVVRAGRATRRDRPDPLADHPFLLRARQAPFHPPPRTEIDPAELAALRRRGLVVEHDGVVFAATALDDAASVVGPLVAAAPEGASVGELRDALGTSRRYAVPLLALLDRAGVTRRVGDRRVPGRNAGRADRRRSPAT